MEQQPTLTLTLTLDQVNLCLAALAKQPFEMVEPVINEIKAQGTAQIQALEAAAAAEISE